MPKRKADQNTSSSGSVSCPSVKTVPPISRVKRQRRIAKPSPTTPPRRSARLREIEKPVIVKQEARRQLPTPLSSFSRSSAQRRKRKQLHSLEEFEERNPSKRKLAEQDTCNLSPDLESDPVAFWAATGFWPKVPGDGRAKMGQKGANDKESSKESSKRKSSSTHHSARLRRLAEHGLRMRSSAKIQPSSKELCRDLLKGDRVPTHFPCYPSDKVEEVLERVHDSNEPILQRDVTPWIVPSVQNLFLCGDLDNDYFMEEKEALWSQCATIGETQPKPDFTFGLRQEAFTTLELQKLRYYASPDRPFLFTQRLCFPFLICEAKSGLEGMDKADRQNLHSGSMAVRAIFSLFKAAFGEDDSRVNELKGKILAFTISHNNRIVNVYGHYAVAKDRAQHELEFFRHDIALFSLIIDEGSQRFKSYNFVRNLYGKFAPEHMKRIQNAVACLPVPTNPTSRSFAATSELGPEETPSQDNGALQEPNEAASASAGMEMAKLREQIDKLLQQLEQQGRDSEQKEERMERLMEQQERQMEQQKRDSKQKEEWMERQMQQQAEQLKELYSLLKTQK
ncbi:MAG: hypothetical protein LQ340_006106, partial [Diploschistes diacapsis]